MVESQYDIDMSQSLVSNFNIIVFKIKKGYVTGSSINMIQNQKYLISMEFSTNMIQNQEDPLLIEYIFDGYNINLNQSGYDLVPTAKNKHVPYQIKYT